MEIKKISNNKKPYKGFKSLQQSLDYVTRPVFVKRGFASAKIITNWDEIVGVHLARFSRPRKLSFPLNKQNMGTLSIEVTNSATAIQLQYAQDLIIEKIAAYFGYKAVSVIKIIQNPQAINFPLISNKAEKITAKDDAKALENALLDIDDPDLKQALMSLGAKILF